MGGGVTWEIGNATRQWQGQNRETWMKEKESKLHLGTDKQDVISSVYIARRYVKIIH